MIVTSNRYHFHGGTPADSTHWTTFSDAVTAAEKAIFPALGSGGCKIIETFGYAAGSDVPVFSKTYTLDGTLPTTGGITAPGDCAALIRYSTNARSTKNHPIYGFNYYHGVLISTTGTQPDTLLNAQRTAMSTYASAWLTGFSDGTNTLVRCTPQDQVCTGQLVETLLTHRDLPR